MTPRKQTDGRVDGTPQHVQDTGGAITMPTIVTGQRLLAAVRDQTFIRGGEETCVEGAKYDLRMGNRLLKAGGGPIDVMKLTETQRSALFIDPGEVAFVLTEEVLNLPNTMAAMLSPKRKLSHEGILVLGGFFIDPLYRGNLLVGLYNFSTTRWPLRPRKKLIAAVFYVLEEGEIDTFPQPESISDFPDDVVRLMQNYQPIRLEGLRDAIRATQQEVTSLKNEVREQDDWKKEFREDLGNVLQGIRALKEEVKKLTDGLENEKSLRVSGDQDLHRDFVKIESRFGQLEQQKDHRRTVKIAIFAAVIGALVTVVVSAVLLGLRHWL
ncbi:MAG: hypothetical protein B7X04_01410 [Parcubacteria group bacterium 21-54-25]|nr:MAG: hypothetical protein B7X04_01410 [Parcubacteria group bacterium 21-54-25]HQU07587.1 hypothetical protein [Candidatus Paceibacterota bacterium]